MPIVTVITQLSQNRFPKLLFLNRIELLDIDIYMNISNSNIIYHLQIYKQRQFYLYLTCLLLIFILFNNCNYFKSERLSATGLSYKEGELHWSINVGVLEDSEFKRAKPEYLDLKLNSSAELIAQILPGLKIKYIRDQALNTVFIMNRSSYKLRKMKKLAPPHLDERSTILFLSKTKAAAKINKKKFNRAGLNDKEIAREIKILKLISFATSELGQALFSNKLSLRNSNWLIYLREQVRYDLILANSIIYPDDAKSIYNIKNNIEDFLRSPSGEIYLGLAPMLGRSGMEGYGSYISLISMNTVKQKASLNLMNLESNITLALISLLFPLKVTAIASPKKFLAFKKFMKSPIGKKYWKKRLKYLESIAHLHKAKKGFCKELSSKYTYYQVLAKNKNYKNYIPSKGHKARLDLQYKKFLNYCGQKKQAFL